MNASFDELINKEQPVLVDFFATWCGPCQTLAPILKQVKESVGEKVSIIKIDVDKNEMVASRFQVRGVPTLILFKNGRQLWRQSGVVTKDELVRILNQHTN